MNLPFGLQIPMVEMFLKKGVEERVWPTVYAKPDTADEVMIAIGKKIVAIEQCMGNKVEKMILADFENPYFPNRRIEVYKEMLQIYDTLNEDDELKDSFTTLKLECNKVKRKWASLYQLCSEYIEGLPENYFEDKGVKIESNISYNDKGRIKDGLARYLEAQCIFGIKWNGRLV